MDSIKLSIPEGPTVLDFARSVVDLSSQVRETVVSFLTLPALSPTEPCKQDTLTGCFKSIVANLHVMQNDLEVKRAQYQFLVSAIVKAQGDQTEKPYRFPNHGAHRIPANSGKATPG